MDADLSPDTIERALTGAFGSPLRVVPVTASTNADALAWALEGAPEGAVVVSDHQTAGRGRWGRSWLSEPGRGLLFSIVLRPDAPGSSLGLLTTALGVACVEGVNSAAGLSCRLKWPNDVTLEGKKLAGILVESTITGRNVDVAVAGIGINVSPLRDAPEDVGRRATSIADATNDMPSRSAVLAAVLAAFEPLYSRVRAGAAEGELIARATTLSEVIGSDVTIRLANGDDLVGRAVRLSPEGALEVESEGNRIRIDAGEVQTLRPA